MVSAWVEYVSEQKVDLIGERNDLLLRLSEIQEYLHEPDYVPERTCKFIADVMNTAFDEDDDEIETGEVDDDAVMSCGNCGYPMVRGEYDGWWDEERGPYGGWFLKPRFNCCPECGSRVIDWDGRKKED